MIGADTAWSRGLDGSGVGVAMIDSGISAVSGTDTAVVHGPDFTGDAATAAAHVDGVGHGTHLAGIVAGRTSSTAGFRGIAPGAHLVDLKVRSASGATDVASVVAAVDWATAHRAELGIGVINLAFNRSQPSPALTAALDRAWDAGIVVVASAGNDGRTGSLTWPAADPRLLTVGATDPSGSVAPEDDRLAAYSSRGDVVRQPDVVAPGRSIVSLVAPGASGPREHPASRVGEHLVKGTGTSQSTAVVSGAVALLRQARPDLGPDAIKALLTGTAQPLVGTPVGSGAGRIDLTRALGSPPTDLAPVASTSARTTAATALAVSGWSGNSWSGNSWSGNSWSGNSWSGQQLVRELVVGTAGPATVVRELVVREHAGPGTRGRATRGPGTAGPGTRGRATRGPATRWSGNVVRQQLVRELVVGQQLVRELVVGQQLVGQQLELSDGGHRGGDPDVPPAPSRRRLLGPVHPPRQKNAVNTLLGRAARSTRFSARGARHDVQRLAGVCGRGADARRHPDDGHGRRAGAPVVGGDRAPVGDLGGHGRPPGVASAKPTRSRSATSR